MRFLFAPFLLSATSFAFQLPFQVPFFKIKQVLDFDSSLNGTSRIAIIGAGAGGSSAAFWISTAKERFGLDVEVDVYDREAYIGGRSTTVYPYDDTSLPSIELGASIFVKANKNLWRASDEFNLTRRTFEADDNTLGVWDGEKLLISVSDGWWDMVKLVWRYGFKSPKKTQSLVDDMIKQYLAIYSAETIKWDDISDLASSFGWIDMVSHTTSDYLLSKGVSRQYAHEFVEAATRVNYGQNVDEIHALEGACSMATNGATGIKGGNYQIFEQFLERSGAKVYLNTTVRSISPKSANSHLWTVRSDEGVVNYKAVILAAPFHSTGIVLPSAISAQIPEQPYVHLHVTLLTTTLPNFDPAYFSLPPSSKTPGMILTTYEGARKGGKKPEFNSISYHGPVREGEWAVKIFSKERISDDWLKTVFRGQVGWVHRKEWDAYPKLPPTTSFPPVKLERGLYYVNAFEPFISTMETETVASRNVVDLLLNEEFGSGICGSRISAPSGSSLRKGIFSSKDKNFVVGWDC